MHGSKGLDPRCMDPKGLDPKDLSPNAVHWLAEKTVHYGEWLARHGQVFGVQNDTHYIGGAKFHIG